MLTISLPSASSRKRRRPRTEECIRVASSDEERRLPQYTVCAHSLHHQVKHSSDCSCCADRMPTIIGNFISRHVYNSKLLTTHKIRSQTCCRFVDVRNGEESKKGLSWMVSITFQIRHRSFRSFKTHSERGRGQGLSPHRQTLHPRRQKLQDHHSVRRTTERDRECAQDSWSALGEHRVQCRLFPRKRRRPYCGFCRSHVRTRVHEEPTTNKCYALEVQEEYDYFDTSAILTEQGRSEDPCRAVR